VVRRVVGMETVRCVPGLAAPRAGEEMTGLTVPGQVVRRVVGMETVRCVPGLAAPRAGEEMTGLTEPGRVVRRVVGMETVRCVPGLAAPRAGVMVTGRCAVALVVPRGARGRVDRTGLALCGSPPGQGIRGRRGPKCPVGFPRPTRRFPRGTSHRFDRRASRIGARSLVRKNRTRHA